MISVAFAHRVFILSVLVLVTTMFGCQKEDCTSEPYKEIELYHLTFDRYDEGWKRYPFISDHKNDSCVFVEDGKLKMIIRPGFHGCGGCSKLGDLHVEIEDNAVKFPEVLDKFGMEITVDRGYFQQIEYHYDTLNLEGQPTSYMQYIKKSSLFLNYNQFSIIFPSPAFGQYENVTDFDLDDNMLDAHHYLLVFDGGEKHIYLDGVEQDVENIQFGNYNWANWAFRLQLDLQRHTMFQDQMEELYISDLRLYTWQGEKQY